MSDHFFVVTGGPGAGKTSLITELARRGFHTIPESGRAIIREEMTSGGDALPWADRLAYADRMLERDLCAYSTAQALPGPVIFDRGVPDILGYLNVPSRMIT
ncbi:AAA family ATPase [Rhodovulum sulfidophilum]|uniref:AAA family ATPase n=1 Tax=Rhodovulum sulfidophilum TaxID=35806 RepID=UPI001F3D06C4|nr:AAA family ATPase [Rhodovulum sulfidophilum]